VDKVNSERMVGFGFKQAWLAVRVREPAAVAAALGLRDLGSVSWREGIDLAYLTDDRLVLTPPLAGARDANWVLATGRWLLRGDSAVDIVKLSSSLDTDVQMFATHRVVELHRWERAVGGVLVRAFCYVGESGEVIDWRGDPDGNELAVGLPSELDAEGDVLVSESDVMRIAGAWSLDPTALDGQPAPGPLRAAAVPSTSSI